jgi:hypothetical protein
MSRLEGNEVFLRAKRNGGEVSAYIPDCSGTRMVKILECAEGLRFSMMEIEDKRNHMGADPGIRYRIGQSGTPAAE